MRMMKKTSEERRAMIAQWDQESEEQGAQSPRDGQQEMIKSKFDQPKFEQAQISPSIP